ncbi:MAG: hypothetical protein R6X02_11460 [Enhygromyxa sp.]
MGDDDSQLSIADRLAAELERSAELVDEGSFDIDAGRALDKLARFQLADPRAYVLRFAEAGLLAGASALRFDVEGAMVRVSFDREGDPVLLPGPALERLLSVLVGRTPIPADWPPRALLMQLAVGVVAALGLEPAYLAIESVGADHRGHRQVFGGEPKLEVLTAAEPGTRIYMVEAAGLDQRIDGLIGQRPEHALLLEHCRHARTPIFLDGRRISQHPVLDQPLLAEPVVDARGLVIGEAGFVAGPPAGARALLLSRGLLIESLPLLDCQTNFLAAIDVPLPRDLSQSAVARSPELDAALAPVYAVHARLAPRVSTSLQRLDPRGVAVVHQHSRGRLLVIGSVVSSLLVAPLTAVAPHLVLGVVLLTLVVVLVAVTLRWVSGRGK